MDEYLLDYLRSGTAWLLVGSGPSAAVGYPSWKQLAYTAIQLCRTEAVGRDLSSLNSAYNSSDFPRVFNDAASLVGIQTLLRQLHAMVPSSPGSTPTDNIYSRLATWPIAVYLTTNFDNEILRHLALAGESSFIDSSNSEDHMARLLPDTSGLVVHLHGDLRSENGLILTSSQYDQILSASEWGYWRSKMTAIFQMNRVIVIGHSLTDRHIRHVLEAAKLGSGVNRPVCWIAPDVSLDDAREYLEKYRIRVISYDNRDGTHRNLTRLVDTISDFVPPRISIQLSSAIRTATSSPLGDNAAAPGFFVFNKLSAQIDFESKRSDVLVSALHGTISRLMTIPPFSIQQALEIAGWPTASPLPHELAEVIAAKAVAENLLIPEKDLFRVAPGADLQIKSERESFERLQMRFRLSIQNRLRRDFSSLSIAQIEEIASDFDAALTGFFREGGLTLASTLSTTNSGGDRPTIPTSIVGFMNQASAKYHDSLRRQAFSSISIGCFVHSEPVEREYLGRISQGFFGFHLLGVFGDAASERLNHAKDTVWLLDSSAQIPAIAVGSTAHSAFRETFKQLSALGLRFFSTEGLFEETQEHLWFADRIINQFGVSSPSVFDAAMGRLPYRKGNLFLEGFINWQAAGNPADWRQYLLEISGLGHIGADTIQSALGRVGIESFAVHDWPGFKPEDYADSEEATTKLVEIAERRNNLPKGTDQAALVHKAKPEAEAFVIVSKEREGKYHMLSQPGKQSSAWFVSQTAVINIIRPGVTITWQPEAFLRFASTLIPASGKEAAERAFSTLLWTIAQTGLTVLDDRLAVRVFGGIIDQAKLLISEQHIVYDEVLAEKYGTPIEKLIDQVPQLDRPLVALQLANERAEKESMLRSVAVAIAAEEKRRASKAEAELEKVGKLRKKLQVKEQQATARKRKNRSRKKRK